MRIPRLLVPPGVALVALVGGATPARAHIEPEPAEAQAGSDLSVGFTVEHGCDGSPTVQLDMRLPTGTTNPIPEPPEGWTGTVAEGVVTFRGGPLPDDQPLTFRVRMTLPPTPDTTVYFPFVQRCEVGEIRWIDTPTDGSRAELDEPAPAMALRGPVATPVTAATTVATTATASTTTTTTATTTTTTMEAAPATTAAPAVVAPTSAAPGAPASSAPTASSSAPPRDAPPGGGGMPAGAWAAAGGLVVAATVTAGLVRQARRGQP